MYARTIASSKPTVETKYPRAQNISPERINAFEQSGLSRRAWCTQAGISVNTLDYWRVRLRKRGHDTACRPASGAAVTAIPVQVAAATASLTVRWGDIELHVPGSMPSAWLVALVRGLRGC